MDELHRPALQMFQSTGLFGWLILLATPGLVLAGILAAAFRVPRFIAVGLLAASLIVPLGIGAAGLFAGRVQVDRIMRSLKATTPRDRACGEGESEFCLMVGLGSALVCYSAALAAFARSKARADEARS